MCKDIKIYKKDNNINDKSVRSRNEMIFYCIYVEKEKIFFGNCTIRGDGSELYDWL